MTPLELAVADSDTPAPAPVDEMGDEPEPRMITRQMSNSLPGPPGRFADFDMSDI